MENGEIISLEQPYKMLHVSKRKAAWMLQNGIIPCEIRNTPTQNALSERRMFSPTWQRATARSGKKSP